MKTSKDTTCPENVTSEYWLARRFDLASQQY